MSCTQGLLVLCLIFDKVCSINFEPPEIDPMDYLNTIYIEQTDLGIGFHNLDE